MLVLPPQKLPVSQLGSPSPPKWLAGAIGYTSSHREYPQLKRIFSGMKTRSLACPARGSIFLPPRPGGVFSLPVTFLCQNAGTIHTFFCNAFFSTIHIFSFLRDSVSMMKNAFSLSLLEDLPPSIFHILILSAPQIEIFFMHCLRLLCSTRGVLTLQCFSQRAPPSARPPGRVCRHFKSHKPSRIIVFFLF